MTMNRYIYGLDPASKADFFGIIIHELEYNSSTPKLRHLEAITHQSFDKMYDHLQALFKKYEPHYICVDYSNERTLSDLIIKQYKERVETIVFSVASKTMLKEDGLAIMKQGYKFPRYSKLTNPKTSGLISQLIQQLQAEQILTTKTGKTTFDHPSGQHNDLAIAWELSIHGCLRFIKEPKGVVVRVEKPKYNPLRELALEGPSTSLYNLGANYNKENAWMWAPDKGHEQGQQQ